jgi:CheY-like chemotaxis protein
MSDNLILHAEDDENYAMLLQCTMEQAGFRNSLRRVKDGADAISYLKGEGEFADRARFPLPYVILADLKMPRVNGLELLKWIRHNPASGHLPVIMLTCSDEIQDVKHAYACGANSFLMKPPRVEDLKEMLAMLNTYWLRYNVTGVFQKSPPRF